MKNYYATLGISENANADEIKKGYRKKSMQFHPDKNKSPDAKDKFQEINEAYETLSNTEKKNRYDFERKNGGSMPRGGGGFPFNQGPGNPFSHSFFNQAFGEQFGNNFGPNVRIFRNGVQVNQKPPDINISVKVSMEKSYSGFDHPLEVERFIVENNVKRTEKETIYIEIPKGVDNNEIMNINQRGNIANGEKSDIKVRILLENNSIFKRKGLDLIYQKNITLKQALCGFNFEIKLLDGKIYTINNSSGNIIKPNFSRNIPNMGMKRDTRSGSLIINFNIIFPDTLTEKVMDKLKEILP